MKNKSLLLVLLMFSFQVIAQGQSPEKIIITEPKSYKDYIFSHLILIENEIKELFFIIYEDSTTGKAEALAQKDKALEAANNSIITLKTLQPIDPDFELKNASIRLISFHKYVLEKSYTEFINIIYSENPDLHRLDYIFEHITVDEEYFDSALKVALDSFKSHYDISIFD